MAEFVRSLAAQGAAKCIVECAQQAGILNGAVAVDPFLAEAEKDLIVKMIAALKERSSAADGKLEADEVSSLFTFVFAKAAECVTNMYNNRQEKIELKGMLTGEIPIYADDAITAEFKASQFPAMCAESYLTWFEAVSGQLQMVEPVLLLFEALKWCFRLSCHYAVTIVETKHR